MFLSQTETYASVQLPDDVAGALRRAKPACRRRPTSFSTAPVRHPGDRGPETLSPTSTDTGVAGPVQRQRRSCCPRIRRTRRTIPVAAVKTAFKPRRPGRSPPGNSTISYTSPTRRSSRSCKISDGYTAVARRSCRPGRSRATATTCAAFADATVEVTAIIETPKVPARFRTPRSAPIQRLRLAHLLPRQRTIDSYDSATVTGSTAPCDSTTPAATSARTAT